MDAKLQVHSNYMNGNFIQTIPQRDSVHPVDFDASQTFQTFQELQPQLSNKDELIRRQGIHKLTQVIKTMVHYGYDKDNHTESTDTIFGNEPRQIFNQALAYLLRLKKRCPFSDVRDESKKILHDLDNRGVRILKLINEEISSFIPTHQILPADTDHPTLSLYTESFVDNCRLEHMVMVMGMHPKYLEIFLKTNTLLLKAKGSLSKPALCYIAIMAAARHKCSYLVHLMEQQFINEGGDRSWLKGIQNAPKKFRNLSTLNKFLAHAPWRITADLIEQLIDCRAREERWQHTDLLQVIVLLCHFQSLSTFCLGTGINLELDHESGLTYEEKEAANNAMRSKETIEKRLSFIPLPEHAADVEELMSRMKKADETEEDFSLSENKERFAFAKQEAFTLAEAEEETSSSEDEYLSRYLEDPDFSFQDEVGEKEEKLRAQDFNWEDKAYHLVSQLHPEVAELLDDKFRITNDLTYKTLATKNDVDTTSLRRGIWMYVQILYNIRYDDYNYGVLSGNENSLLERPLKAFIKTITCYPEKVTKEKYDSFWKQFKHSEKVHVNIMAKEAKLQVGLMYGVKAFTQYYVKR